MILAASPDASWNPEPGAIALIVLLGFLYVRRWRKVRAHDGPRAAPTWRLWVFIGGLVAIAAALISPIDELGHQVLAMHMVQHVILLDIVPILLILGLTKALMRPITRRLQPIEHGPLATHRECAQRAPRPIRREEQRKDPHPAADPDRDREQ